LEERWRAGVGLARRSSVFGGLLVSEVGYPAKI
jgi:hypothetical protein